ncbi:ribonucleases P/MRP protein subunit POP1-like isoform X2 [Brachyhypopomus gauderio]
MSGAKDRMRHKKMRNQPSNVMYSSSRDCGNGGGIAGGSHTQSGGWPRGRQDGVPPDQALPKYITASVFAKARAVEVSAMMRAVTKMTASCHVFGALPKHMRRRAMSHDPRRLPCQLREAAHRALKKSQQAGQKEKKEQSKTKSRRARRRHGNLLLEFNRRQRKNKWLETHIWHAKRFHMLKTWGYCLGDTPTYKCYRASYRAMSSGCLLQDLSYHCCVELCGPEEKLLRALSRLTSKDTGPTFAGALHVSGQREGRVMLYRPDQYPHHPLGPAQFLWRPCSVPCSHRQLWIWVHPTLKQDLLLELQAVCECFVAVPNCPASASTSTRPASEPQTDADLGSHASEPQTDADLGSHASEPQTDADLGSHASEPQTEADLGSHASEPQTEADLGSHASEPQTDADLGSHASEPQTEADLGSHASEPQTEADLGSHASEPQTDADLCSHASTSTSTRPASEPQHPGKKRKREVDCNDGTSAKKVLGDGTRSPSTPVRWKSSSSEIVISDLTMEIVRYRLIGPLSHSVLTDTLLPATAVEIDNKMAASPFWWSEKCKNEDFMTLHHRQADIFHLLRGVYSTDELPAGCVLGMTVDDPRLTLPKKRGKVAPDLEGSQDVDKEQMMNLSMKGVPAVCAQSALWDQSVRDNVTHNKISEQDLNRMKKELLVPGSRLPTPAQGRVPILLVHQVGRQQGEDRPGWGCGWDLLLPKAWGMAFWVPLVYRGVRVGGLQMSLKHSQFKGVPHFPHDYPDCPAGAHFQEQQAAELLETFKRRPPSKRTNYIKHGSLAPFRCPWQQLAEEWDEIVKQDRDNHDNHPVKMEGEAEPGGPSGGLEVGAPPAAFTVLRSRKVLRQLSVWCLPSSARAQRVRRGSPAPALSPVVAMALQREWGRCLVWVRVCVLGKGRPAMHTMLCVPTAEDLQRLRGDPRSSGPVEPRHRDHLQHLLKRTRKDRPAPKCPGATKEDCSPAPTKEQAAGPAPRGEQLSSPSVQPQDPTPTVETGSVIGCGASSVGLVRGLWPEPLPSVSSHCSRVTLGWVTQGDFSLATGVGEALGLVSLPGLLHTLLSQPADQRGTVLLRNASSLQYRYARLLVET